jgi:hypothetical protein
LPRKSYPRVPLTIESDLKVKGIDRDVVVSDSAVVLGKQDHFCYWKNGSLAWQRINDKVSPKYYVPYLPLLPNIGMARDRLDRPI